MKKIYVGNLPRDATEAFVREIFSEYGSVRSLKLASDIFTGACRGFAFIEMEGHEARAAVAVLDGKVVGNHDKPLRVRFDNEHRSRGRRRR
jgi:RNA recognition motif-containing protein